MTFPAAGPTSTELVKAHLRIGDAVDDGAIEPVVAAVNQLVRELPIAAPFDADPAPASWAGGERIIQGATMLAARLWERRNSPNGVAVFSEAAPAYVQRNDPDVALLLKLGPYAEPTVG